MCRKSLVEIDKTFNLNILILINPILAEPVSMSKCLYSILNKLAGLQQNKVVDNKRLCSVLAHIQQQHEELEKQNKRSRAKKSMPSRKAQKADIEQRKLNPVLDSCS